jgi:CheY-like chemotaxis protein
LARTVLLVAHGPALRTVVHLHVAAGGAYDVVEARDVPEGVAELRRREIHLVIADVSGGEADARALVAALRGATAAYYELPIVLLAPRRARGLKRTAASAGACAVVSKPVTGPRLRAAIASVLPP